MPVILFKNLAILLSRPFHNSSFAPHLFFRINTTVCSEILVSSKPSSTSSHPSFCPSSTSSHPSFSGPPSFEYLINNTSPSSSHNSFLCWRCWHSSQRCRPWWALLMEARPCLLRVLLATMPTLTFRLQPCSGPRCGCPLPWRDLPSILDHSCFVNSLRQVYSWTASALITLQLISPEPRKTLILSSHLFRTIPLSSVEPHKISKWLSKSFLFKTIFPDQSFNMINFHFTFLEILQSLSLHFIFQCQGHIIKVINFHLTCRFQTSFCCSPSQARVTSPKYLLSIVLSNHPKINLNQSS